MQNTNWNQIVKKFGPLVWHTAFKLLDNKEDAADCFQQTFLNALEYSKKNKIKHYPAFLTKAATSRAIDILRQRKTQCFCDDAVNFVETNERDPMAAIETKELADKLRFALSWLIPIEAEIFALRHFNNMSYGEIAKSVGISTSNVGVILLRAKSKIKKHLEAQGVQKKGVAI